MKSIALPLLCVFISANAFAQAHLPHVSAEFEALRSGVDLAPHLQALKRLNPRAHGMLADGSYDGLSADDRFVFVVGAMGIDPQQVGIYEAPRVPPSADHDSILLSMLLVQELSLRWRESNPDLAGTCAEMKRLAGVLQSEFGEAGSQRPAWPHIRELLADAGALPEGCL